MRNEDDMTDLDTSKPAEFPSGRIKDDPLTGTAINNAIFHDLYVTLQKWAKDSGIVVNHEEDKVGSYQLEAAIKQVLIAPDFKTVGNDGGITSYINGWTGNLKWGYLAGGSIFFVEGYLDGSSKTADGFIQFPEGYFAQFGSRGIATGRQNDGSQKLYIVEPSIQRFLNVEDADAETGDYTVNVMFSVNLSYV